MELVHRVVELLPEIVSTGLLDASGGNLAVRVTNGISITPTQAAEQLRWRLSPEDFIMFPGGGEASMARAGRRPSRDSRIHRAVLAEFKNWNFSFHGHCWGLLGYAVAGCPLPVPACHAELLRRRKDLKIPVVPPVSSSSPELGELTAALLRDHFDGCPHGAVLLSGHGVVVAGEGIESTLSLVQTLENLARGQQWRLGLAKDAVATAENGS